MNFAVCAALLVRNDSCRLGVDWSMALQSRLTQNYSGVQSVFDLAHRRVQSMPSSPSRQLREYSRYGPPRNARFENELTTVVSSVLDGLNPGSVRCCSRPDLRSMRQCTDCDQWWVARQMCKRTPRAHAAQLTKSDVDWSCPECAPPPTTTTTTTTDSQSQRPSQRRRRSRRARVVASNEDNTMSLMMMKM